MATPSDLELMMFADGELEEPRRTEVARYIDSTDGHDSKLKLKGMGIVGELTRQHASRIATLHDADGIAASVMKAIEVEAAGGARDRVGGPKRERAKTGLDPLPGDTSGEPLHLPGKSSGPANDNSRLIYGLAALAAAAAVALGVWGRGASAPDVASATRSTSTEHGVEVAPPASQALAPEVAPSANSIAIQLENPDEPLVKVASVDFGAKRGAIYYVPKEGAPEKGPSLQATTTVVWVSDE